MALETTPAPNSPFKTGSFYSARRSEAIDISSTDSVPTETPDALFVGVAGDVTGKLLDDSSNSTFTLSAGIHPLRFKIITKTDTDAEQMKYLYGG